MKRLRVIKMTGYTVKIWNIDPSASIDDIAFALKKISNKIQEGYTMGEEDGIAYEWDEV